MKEMHKFAKEIYPDVLYEYLDSGVTQYQYVYTKAFTFLKTILTFVNILFLINYRPSKHHTFNGNKTCR